MEPDRRADGGVHATEPSNASRTMLYDIGALAWSDELLDLFGVPPSCLPEVRPSGGRFGTGAPACRCPRGRRSPASSATSRPRCSARPASSPGMTKNTYGTGSFVLMNVGDACPPPVEGLLTTVAWTLAGQPGATYALEGSIFVTGAAVQWLRDHLGIIAEPPRSRPLAATCADTGGAYIVPRSPASAARGGTPTPAGAIVGITRGTGRAELARAVLESMAYQTRDVVDAMAAPRRATPSPSCGRRRRSAADLLLQVQADQLGVPVSRPVVQETTALGAGYVAGLAEGVWDADDLAERWQLDRASSRRRRRGRGRRLRRLARAVERSRAPGLRVRRAHRVGAA